MRPIFLAVSVLALASACKHGDERASGTVGTSEAPAPTATETANQLGQGAARDGGGGRAALRPQVPRRGPGGPNAQDDPRGGVVSDTPTAVAGGTGGDDGGAPAVLGGSDHTLDAGPAAYGNPNPLDASFAPPGAEAGPLVPRP